MCIQKGGRRRFNRNERSSDGLKLSKRMERMDLAAFPSSRDAKLMLTPMQQRQIQKPQRKCAEVCMDLLAAECVRLFSSQQPGGPTAAAAMEAVGIRVGKQLAER